MCRVCACVSCLTRSPKSVIGSPISLNLFLTKLSFVGTTTDLAFFVISNSFKRRACSDLAWSVDSESAKVSEDGALILILPEDIPTRTELLKD